MFCGIMLNHLFAMSQLSAICMLLLIVFGFAAESLFRYLTLLVEKADEWVEKKSGHVCKERVRVFLHGLDFGLVIYDNSSFPVYS